MLELDFSKLLNGRNIGVVIGLLVIFFGFARSVNKINTYRSKSSSTGSALVDRFANGVLQIILSLLIAIVGLGILIYTGFFVQ